MCNNAVFAHLYLKYYHSSTISVILLVVNSSLSKVVIIY